MAKIIVLGAGVMGSAFAQLLADTGNEVYLVGTHLDQEIIDNVLADGTHPKLKVRLPKNVRAHSYKQLEGIVDERVQLIVFGVNSAGVDWAVARIGPLLKTPVPIVMLTKGLAVRKHSIIILPQAVEEGLSQYGLSGIPVAAVGGPCIAGELAARRQSSVVMACPDTDLLDWLLNLVAAPYYHVRGSTDLIGVEVCAALKNFYTLAVGYAAGQLEHKGQAPNGALMHNLAAGLFTQALAEIQYFVDLLGGQSDSVLGLAGAGDLYVTCQAGRNGRMGKLLGVGMLYREAKSNHMADDTVEGAELAVVIGAAVRQLIASAKIDGKAVPLAVRIIEAICDNQPLQIPWNMFYRKL
ncbi:MAG: glycerol-3-phosphate dehydrogenase [Deltaproteobacteria bacterium]|jgi:glycerol-3-phosphate dehydrogenase (NAD(P)+)|nr:glycerol-3-phosphate dehydrogenase [Deltaproteobacteria bacterium]